MSDDIAEKIRKLSVLTGRDVPMPRGTWAIEVDAEGYQIAVKRDRLGALLAFMRPDDARAMGLIETPPHPSSGPRASVASGRSDT